MSKGGGSSSKVKVAVRVRPFNKRERELGTECVVSMNNNCTVLSAPNTSANDRRNTKRFYFDSCFDSIDPMSPNYSDQATVFEGVGLDLLQNAFQGYNACILAYGQTGSGKSYTMMGGSGEECGIIPRLCHELFFRMTKRTTQSVQFKVEMSYMEIYNEKVHDLLDPRDHSGGGSRSSQLKVREHKILGPYVDGLAKLAVSSSEDICQLMEVGNRARTVAATNMNSESSRSHAVFTIFLTQHVSNLATKMTGEKASRISLVDLAGSERANKTGAAGDRLKEGSNINKSLTTLGLVISALAEQSSASSNSMSKKKSSFVPYRDSTLTWLLKDSLGGNSKTVMIATISPAADNYDESLSTLRYADRAKRIVNNAIINEDPNAKIIRELREEVERLRRQLADALKRNSLLGSSTMLESIIGELGRGAEGEGEGDDSAATQLREQLAESERLMQQMSLSWEQRLQLSQQMAKARQNELENLMVPTSMNASSFNTVDTRNDLNEKIFIVNLNSDPFLNEKLAYHIKPWTTVGREESCDIELTGLGIQDNHCAFEITNNDLFIVPSPNAKTCINGVEVKKRSVLCHCDRVLWGHSHLFRVHCPLTNHSQSHGFSRSTDTSLFDFEMATNEVLQQSASNDSVVAMLSRLENAFNEDKEDVKEKQKQMYERNFSLLHTQLSEQQLQQVNWDNFNSIMPQPQNQSQSYDAWVEKQDEAFKCGLRRLKESLSQALSLSKEAEGLAKEMDKKTSYKVTLQIPAANLTPNKRLFYGSGTSTGGGLLCEPAVVVRRTGRPPCVWSVNKLDNRVVEMRHLYQQWKQNESGGTEEGQEVEGELSLYDPFYEVQDSHDLIGVANVFLECLFYDVTLKHNTPIISQQGEVSGKLSVELSRTGGSLMGYRMADAGTTGSGQDDNSSEVQSVNSQSSQSSSSEPRNTSPVPSVLNTPQFSNSVTCKLKIQDAHGLPVDKANFVFCSFEFLGQDWDQPVTVVQKLNPEDTKPDSESGSVSFGYENEFVLNVTEEFLEFCSEGSLAIEVYGHRKGSKKDPERSAEKEKGEDAVASLHDSISKKNKHLIDRWNEVKASLEMWVEIQEINDHGEFAPVDVLGKNDVPTGGVYQLKQGHTRHVKVCVGRVSDGGGELPLVVDSVVGLQMGCVIPRNKQQAPLDSFQDDDLVTLRDRWAQALSRRKQYLEEQLKLINNNSEKSESDLERENILLDQWVSLTEERNAVLVPAPGSSIPGAKSRWNPVPGMETSKTVLFLDLDPQELVPMDGCMISGVHSYLYKEDTSTGFFPLPLIEQSVEGDVTCVATWDSSVHKESCLNKPTLGGDRIYLILKAIVHISLPTPMELVLRKRICCVIYKRPSLANVFRRKMFGTGLALTGITFQIVAHIPQSSEDMETKESLAQLAASGNNFAGGEGSAGDGLEMYTQSLASVESLLTFDRLKQEVAMLEAMKAKGVSLSQQASQLPSFLPLLRVGSTMTTGSGEDDLRQRARKARLNENSPMWSPASSATSLTSLQMIPQPSGEDPYGSSSFLGGPLYRNRNALHPRRHSLTPSAMRRSTSYSFNHPKLGGGGIHFSRENSVQSLAGGISTAGYSGGVDTEEGPDHMMKTYYMRNMGAVSSSFSSQQTLRPPSGLATATGNVSRERVNSDADLRQSTGSRLASIENLEHKPDESCGSLTDQPSVPQIIHTPDFETDSWGNAVNVSSGKAHSNAGRRSSSPAGAAAAKSEIGPSQKFRHGTNEKIKSSLSASHLMSLSNSSVVTRSKSPRRGGGTRLMATLEEQEDEPSLRKKSLHRESSNTFTEEDYCEACGTAPDWVEVGVSVRVGPNKRGVVKYVGRTHFSEGCMVGVALDSPHGRHDGAVDSVRYFQCLPNHGVFLRADRLQLDKQPKSSSSHNLSGTSGTQAASSRATATLRGTLAARKATKVLADRSASKDRTK